MPEIPYKSLWKVVWAHISYSVSQMLMSCMTSTLSTCLSHSIGSKSRGGLKKTERKEMGKPGALWFGFAPAAGEKPNRCFINYSNLCAPLLRFRLCQFSATTGWVTWRQHCPQSQSSPASPKKDESVEKDRKKTRKRMKTKKKRDWTGQQSYFRRIIGITA